MESTSLEPSSSLAVLSSSTTSSIQFPEDSEEIDDATTDSENERKKETKIRLQSIFETEGDVGSHDELTNLDYTRFKTCVVCQQPITELLVWALNRPHHCKCLTCFVCDKPIAFKKFKITEGKHFMCYKDYYESYQKCRVCQKTINASKQPTEPQLTYDKLFHEDCFKCPNCFCQMKMEFSAELFDDVYCGNCATEIAAKKNALRHHYLSMGRMINDQEDPEVVKPEYASEGISDEFMEMVGKILKKMKT